jgi:alkylated DNA nucleotide flippase Atl1
MTIASTRAQAVAEILWELKKADKLATQSAIAGRAGFSAGPQGRTISACLKNVRRDWPHLQWWRAVADNGQLESEQATCLKEAGYGTSAHGESFEVSSFTEQLMTWEVEVVEVVEAGRE